MRVLPVAAGDEDKGFYHEYIIFMLLRKTKCKNHVQITSVYK
jgi:hypothetical protein